jgi:hypothetical protein
MIVTYNRQTIFIIQATSLIVVGKASRLLYRGSVYLKVLHSGRLRPYRLEKLARVWLLIIDEEKKCYNIDNWAVLFKPFTVVINLVS